MHNGLKHINRSELKSTEAMDSLLDSVLDEALRVGATDAAVSVSHEHGFAVNVRLNAVETLAFSEQRAISVTVYHGLSMGSASSSDTSSSSLKSMVAAAYDIAKVSAPDPCFGLADKRLVSNTYPELDLAHPWHITPTDAITRAMTLESYALQLDKRISNSDGVSLSTYATCFGYANSHGFRGIVPSTRHSLSASFIVQDEEKMQRDYAYTTARYVDGLLTDEALAQLAVERTVSRIGARRLKTQRCPVLFSSRVSSGLFSTVIQAMSGGNLYRNNSFLLNKLGERVFPEFISVHEQPHLLRALGSAAFDEEGIVTRANRFIEHGILSQYVLGSYSARKLGLETTANSGGVSNLTVDPTSGDLNALLNTMHTGLLVTELMGHGVNLLTGDYSRGATGFWVEHGVVQYPVEEVTIAGNLTEMLAGVVAVGSDWDPNRSTRCGTVLINQMMVAGEA